MFMHLHSLPYNLYQKQNQIKIEEVFQKKEYFYKLLSN